MTLAGWPLLCGDSPGLASFGWKFHQNYFSCDCRAHQCVQPPIFLFLVSGHLSTQSFELVSYSMVG